MHRSDGVRLLLTDRNEGVVVQRHERQVRRIACCCTLHARRSFSPTYAQFRWPPLQVLIVTHPDRGPQGKRASHSHMGINGLGAHLDGDGNVSVAVLFPFRHGYTQASGIVAAGKAMSAATLTDGMRLSRRAEELAYAVRQRP